MSEHVWTDGDGEHKVRNVRSDELLSGIGSGSCYEGWSPGRDRTVNPGGYLRLERVPGPVARELLRLSSSLAIKTARIAELEGLLERAAETIEDGCEEPGEFEPKWSVNDRALVEEIRNTLSDACGTEPVEPGEDDDSVCGTAKVDNRYEDHHER